MKKIIFLNTFFLISFISFAQQKNDYKVYQFFGKDSLNVHISKISKFNQNRQKIYEELIDYKSSKVNGTSDYIENYFYKDTLLISSEKTGRNSKNKSIVTHSALLNEINF